MLGDSFPWSVRNSKSPQVSRTLLSILADFNNAVVWIVFTRPVISKYSSPGTNSLVTVPSAPVIIGSTVTFMFHRFFPGKFFLFAFFQFSPCSAGTAKPTIR